jgi:hypothetical protein
MTTVSLPHKLYHYTPAMRGKYGFEKMALVHVRHIYSQPSNTDPKLYKQLQLKHGMVCFICTTNLSHGLTPHLILDLAQDIQNLHMCTLEGVLLKYQLPAQSKCQLWSPGVWTEKFIQ